MKTDIDAILDRIRAYRRHEDWSINRLATEARVPWSVLKDMDAPTWSPSLKTLRALLAIIPDGFCGDGTHHIQAAE